MGFRRSGKHVYRPHCGACQACIPVRIPVNKFRPNRSQKRCLKNNADLNIRVILDISGHEYYELYERYINHRHDDGDMYPPSYQQYSEFLSSEWGITRHLEFRDSSGQLVGVAVCDRLASGLSAIYTFFEPDQAKRSLGTYAILTQTSLARDWNLPFVYLGYWIKACDKMRYKNQFKPLQMYIDQQWQDSHHAE